MGRVIDRWKLAQRLSSFLDAEVSEIAYELRPVPGSRCVERIERTATGDIRHTVEPDARRATHDGRFPSVLPIEWLL